MKLFTEEQEFLNLRHFLEHDCPKRSQLFILVDENTEKHCLKKLATVLPLSETPVISIAAGEENKNMSSCEKIWKRLTEAYADRHTLLINLGGGLVTDIGGFAASVYKRGIPFIHIPTTLLSMTDAAIGGKTGIDYARFKNHIGTFCMPMATFIYPGFLDTLDQRNKKSGIAEMIKHSLVGDITQWQIYKEADEHLFYTTSAILESAAIKIRIVNEDPLEKGKRKLLNFGHTIGHALESYSLTHDTEPLLHGEAVAMGILCESWISTILTGLESNDLFTIKNLVMSHFKKYTIEPATVDVLIGLMKQDKKNTDGGYNFSLLISPGEGIYDVVVEEPVIRKALNWYMAI